ncbi:MAG TPA: SufE family protein [Gammaproteobacteria bacterium]|nr:SufE family protein [Gammaproteobacteria bacterium]MCP5428682.1 SufE family protein [Chromatiaceae bacterium]MCW5584927.1 SufE family protein [Chromatiales bacterium]HOP17117.1 SufE family protein [Gammaproteobacteria bacterium]HPQ23956.1 SufE family protein [Gammaproteobacteria bacterium]
MLTADEFVENFEFLDDWDARYAYLVELGEALPPLDEGLRTEENRVQGCISKVWVAPLADPQGQGRIRYVGDCDTAIIKGVLAVLVELLSGHTAQEIEALDIDALFDRIRLAENLSPNRHFGIYAIVELMKSQARAFAHR